MTQEFRPMKAADLDGVDLRTLRYPLFGSPKIDGMRCLIRDGRALTSSLREFPNKSVQAFFANGRWNGCDGEIVVGAPYATGDGGTVLGRTGAVKSVEGRPDFHFHAFDLWSGPARNYSARLAEMLLLEPEQRASVLAHATLKDVGDLLRYEQTCLNLGYEGIIVRSMDGPYKYGRSTLREGIMMKLKRFIDGEAVVTGIVEAVENQNAPTINAVGLTERRGGKAATAPKGMLGSILATNVADGTPMNIGPGVMSHDERRRYFESPQSLIGQTVHWRAFNYDIKDKLRFALYYGLRQNGE